MQKKVKKAKRKSFPALKEEADKLFSKYIRDRDEWKCITPSEMCSDSIQCGHLISRGKYWVRYDLDNCFAQCSKHNWMHTFPANYQIMQAAVLKRIGQERYLAMEERSRNIGRFGRQEIESIIKLFGGDTK